MLNNLEASFSLKITVSLKPILNFPQYSDSRSSVQLMSEMRS